MRKGMLRPVLALAFLACSLFSLQAAPGAAAVEQRIVVFSKGTPLAKRLSLVEQAGGSVTDNLWIIDALSVAVPAVEVRSLEEKLSSSPYIRSIEKDFDQDWLLQEPPPPSPQEFPGTPSLPWNIKRVRAPQAWAVTRGAGVKVAVLDTGADLKHPGLKIAGGYNAVERGAAPPADDVGHGTHVLGIIAAQDVGRGVIGVAPEAEAYTVKVLSKGSGNFTTIIAGLQWCLTYKMDVANMSFGAKAGSRALAEAVRNAAAAGLTLVAAAGNTDEPVVFPAAYPEVIAVGASDMKNQVPDWSARGPELALVAPGVEIRSTRMGGDYQFKEGTSMSSPHVSGLAALLVSAQGKPDPRSIRRFLQAAATPLAQAPAEKQGAGLPDGAKLVLPAP